MSPTFDSSKGRKFVNNINIDNLSLGDAFIKKYKVPDNTNSHPYFIFTDPENPKGFLLVNWSSDRRGVVIGVLYAREHIKIEWQSYVVYDKAEIYTKQILKTESEHPENFIITARHLDEVAFNRLRADYKAIMSLLPTNEHKTLLYECLKKNGLVIKY